MEKFRKILCSAFLACTLLCGCRKQAPVLPKTVTQVDILGTHQQHTIQRHYTQPQKMEGVLNFLRLLDYNGLTSLDPALLPGNDFQITLSFSDGDSKIYRIHGGRYLCRPTGKWEKVDPDTGNLLMPYLSVTASDL